jgi:hypothetical protein
MVGGERRCLICSTVKIMSESNENLVSALSFGEDPKPLVTRNAKGQLQKGSKLNVGGARKHKYYEWKRELQSAIKRKVTAEDMEEVFDRLIELAKQGQAHAVATLMNYSLGRPVEGTNPVDLELDLPVPKRIEDLNNLLLSVTVALTQGKMSQSLGTVILSALRLALAGDQAEDLQNRVDAILDMLNRRESK